MCTFISEKTPVAGCGKGTANWIKVNQVNVSYDHPTQMTLEHALNIDFVDESQGLGARVAVELTPKSARRLVDLINIALDRGAAVDPAAFE